MTHTFRLSNEYGSSLVTCSVHEKYHRQHLLGTLKRSETTEDDVCDGCRSDLDFFDAPAKMEAAMLSLDHSHTRFRYGYIYAYKHDPNSPSGVTLSAGLDPERYEILEAKLRKTQRISGPLSPTEGLRFR